MSRQAISRHLPGRLAPCAVALVLLCATTGGSDAGSFTRGCAARDLELLMLIEDRESRNAVSADRLNDALISMLEARIVCHQGRVMDAIALYDDIARSIALGIAAEAASPAEPR